jgi:flagellum-specific ATP synthase
VMNDIVSPEQKAARNQLVSLLAIYRKAEDLINIGAYVKGSNPQIDYAIKKIGEVQTFLRQGVDEKVPFAECLDGLRSLFP